VALAPAARLWLGLAGLAGAAGVALAAMAAHRPPHDPELARRAAEFLLFHAPALAVTAWLADRRRGLLPQAAGLAFLGGLVLFAGTLALRGLGVEVPGGGAPFGGIALIAGWLILAVAALLPRR
jgi:uncharacterized membrane protein YgdD (TMEM256/DUF423 family)